MAVFWHIIICLYFIFDALGFLTAVVVDLFDILIWSWTYCIFCVYLDPFLLPEGFLSIIVDIWCYFSGFSVVDADSSGMSILLG